MNQRVGITIRREIWRLRKIGLSYRLIANIINEEYNLNISHSTVRYALDSEYRRKERIRANVNYFNSKGGNTLNVEPVIFY